MATVVVVPFEGVADVRTQEVVRPVPEVATAVADQVT